MACVCRGFTEDLWVDVGSPERYRIATRLLLERLTATAGASVLGREQCHIGENVVFEGMVALGEGATIGDGVRIVGPSVIGTGTIVASDVLIEGTAIWESAKVGARSHIVNSIVGGSARIGADVVLKDAVLADGAVVGDGRHPGQGARVGPGERA